MRRRLPPHESRVTVVGLDLSLRGPAACAIPLPWDHNMQRVQTIMSGVALKQDASFAERDDRIAKIAEDIVNFCRRVGAIHVAKEEYAYNAGGANATQLAELGGVVKREIRKALGLVVYHVQASSARKVLLQRVPRLGAGKTKPWVVKNIKRLGGPTEAWTDDECDAFAICNTVLMHAGGIPMSFQGE